MSHPDERFEGSSLWAAIEAEVNALIASGALTLTMGPQHVIGALCARVESEGLLQPSSARSDRSRLTAALDGAAAVSRGGSDWKDAIATHYPDPSAEEARRQAALTALRLDHPAVS